MRFGVLLLLALAIALFFVGANSTYNLVDNYHGTSFFNNFNFFNGADPTHGYVYYTTQQQAQDWGFIKASTNNVYIGSDHSVKSSGSGRGSVRISSKKAFNSGLFILDLAHMPEGCGTWPAFWLVGPNWPNSGEIDIIEGVNNQVNDQSTLHTSNGCDQSNEDPGSFTGTWANGPNGPSRNCYVNAPGEYANAGCGIISNAQIYGSKLNAMGGGVYATQWASDSISIWFWARGHIPQDVQNNKPNPAGWGRPYARFGIGGNCPSNHFANMNIVINLTFCGDWAGGVFGQMCGGDCVSFVQNNPGAFANAYWTINSIKVYQQ